MNDKSFLQDKPILVEIDLKLTERPEHKAEMFFWDGDVLVRTGQRRTKMEKVLSGLSPSHKISFKHRLISFAKQGNYAPNSLTAIFEALKAALKSYPTSTFNTNWISQALNTSSFHRQKCGIARLLLHWKEYDNTAITEEAIDFLDNTVALRNGRRNVLSDDSEKSWLTDQEYEYLLSAVWDNYDSNASSTQITLIRLLSMQYARRPIQIAHLKIGDIREKDSLENYGLAGRIVSFPAAKDMTAETDFRNSKFEPHPLADHLWDLCQVQREEVRAMYEQTLGVSITGEELKKLPLFCSKARVEEARQLIQEHYQLDLFENLDSELFHLHKSRISKILIWEHNSPNCTDGTVNYPHLSPPKPPLSPRTGRTMVVSATRMRHTRARQLARKGVPMHVLSHWLGHTSVNSLSAYYNDPAEQARQLDEAMAPVLSPLAMAFTGTLIDTEDQATRANDPSSKLEFARAGELMNVGRCGKHSFCATTSVPIPCYRCKHFEPLVNAPHQEVLTALLHRQMAEEQALKIGGSRNLLIPINLSTDIRAVENCILLCNACKAQPEMEP